MRLRLRTRGKLMLSNFRLGQSETPTSKNDLLIFLTNKRLLAGTIYIRFLIYVTAIYEQKNERNWFFNSCHEIKVLVDFSWPSLLNCLPTVVLFSSENHFLKPPRRSSLNLFSRTDMLRNKRPRCLVNGSSVCAIANG